ncbi:Hypothetical predicted protein [Paramuricea clavata]|uniref:Uncharacterized protein n=1 Tax=Paramuricea clavata TaxID=317549 RepID=A0A6S7GRX0_PARCT|nr:Hypothetical predicted protein [Paramuricea clavata]
MSTLLVFTLVSLFVSGYTRSVESFSSLSVLEEIAEENDIFVKKRSVRTPRQGSPISNDINACLFTSWKTGKILSTTPSCNGANQVQLCYGLPSKPAKFAVCYNTQRKIPEFTGYVIQQSTSVNSPPPPKKNKNPDQLLYLISH